LPNKEPDEEYETAEEFLTRLDLGYFDEPGGFSAEIRKLSTEQLEEIAKILLKRTAPPLST
jgi:hypothetical protein